MATQKLLVQEVSDLCLGKPPLKSLPISATIGDALFALKNSSDNYFLSVWSCDHTATKQPAGLDHSCECVGKVCMVDVICHLCKDENLLSPSLALNSPVSVLLPKDIHGFVRHVDPSSSLVEAIDLFIQGAQNLVVPIKTRPSSIRRKHHPRPSPPTATVHNGQEYCWLTQEDVIRFLLSSIGLFSPLPALSIEKLGIINTQFSSIEYDCPASLALHAISTSLREQTSVAVTDSDGLLIGELSPLTLACCDETVAAAITTLSAGDLIAYIDCGGPPDDLVRMVVARLKHRGLDSLLHDFTDSTDSSSWVSSSSSDEEFGGGSTPVTTLRKQGKYGRSASYSGRMVRRAEAIVCHPKSSLVAVMIQAIAHRVNYVWVIEDDCSLVGLVTFVDILKAFRDL